MGGKVLVGAVDAMFCFLRWYIGARCARLTAGPRGPRQGNGGFLIQVGMRLILTGIGALSAGFAFGLALQSEDEIGSADAELRAKSPRLSIFGTIHPKRFDLPAPLGSQISDGSRVRVASLGTDVAFVSAVEETDRGSDPPVPTRQRMSFDKRFSFDERFLSYQPTDSFDQRFATAAVSLAGAPAMTAETEKSAGSALRIARLPSPDPRQRAMAHPAVGRSAPRLASLASPPPASSAKKKYGWLPWKRRRARACPSIPTAALRSTTSPRVRFTCPTDAG